MNFYVFSKVSLFCVSPVALVALIIRSNMNFDMFYEILLLCVGFTAMVALERSLPRVRPHVPLQLTRSNAGVVALVTFERLLSCVLPHHVKFQITSLNARILACCASVWLFTRVRLLVDLQVACFCCFIFTLIALVQIFPGVHLDVRFEVGCLVA